jgi:hypothetical protein
MSGPSAVDDQRVSGPDAPAARIRMVMRCYPVEWRDRYGAELEGLLADAAAEGGGWRNWVDAIRGGLVVRADTLGVTTQAAWSARRQRNGLIVALVGAVIFVASARLGLQGAGWQPLAWSTTASSSPTTVVAGEVARYGITAVEALAVMVVGGLVLSLARTTPRSTLRARLPVVGLLLGAGGVFAIDRLAWWFLTYNAARDRTWIAGHQVGY